MRRRRDANIGPAVALIIRSWRVICVLLREDPNAQTNPGLLHSASEMQTFWETALRLKQIGPSVQLAYRKMIMRIVLYARSYFGKNSKEVKIHIRGADRLAQSIFRLYNLKHPVG